MTEIESACRRLEALADEWIEERRHYNTRATYFRITHRSGIAAIEQAKADIFGFVIADIRQLVAITRKSPPDESSGESGLG